MGKKKVFLVKDPLSRIFIRRSEKKVGVPVPVQTKQTVPAVRDDFMEICFDIGQIIQSHFAIAYDITRLIPTSCITEALSPTKTCLGRFLMNSIAFIYL